MEMARTEVTKHLCNYIKQNSLQNPSTKSKFNQIHLLQFARTLAEGKGIYTLIFKYVKHHFQSLPRAPKV